MRVFEILAVCGRGTVPVAAQTRAVVRERAQSISVAIMSAIKLDFDTPADIGNEIKLWDRSVVPLASVTREDYRPHSVAPAAPASRPGYVPNPHKLEGRTTNQDAYQAIPLPVGVQALGVQTQGGSFYPLIPQGSLPPARGEATFTTTRDYQTEVDIKVTAMVDGVAQLLGQFALGGIAPTLTGIPQVLVTFELSEQRMLTVSAVDTGSGGEMVLTVRCVS